MDDEANLHWSSKMTQDTLVPSKINPSFSVFNDKSNKPASNFGFLVIVGQLIRD